MSKTKSHPPTHLRTKLFSISRLSRNHSFFTYSGGWGKILYPFWGLLFFKASLVAYLVGKEFESDAFESSQDFITLSWSLEISIYRGRLPFKSRSMEFGPREPYSLVSKQRIHSGSLGTGCWKWRVQSQMILKNGWEMMRMEMSNRMNFREEAWGGSGPGQPELWGP